MRGVSTPEHTPEIEFEIEKGYSVRERQVTHYYVVYNGKVIGHYQPLRHNYLIKVPADSIIVKTYMSTRAGFYVWIFDVFGNIKNTWSSIKDSVKDLERMCKKYNIPIKEIPDLHSWIYPYIYSGDFDLAGDIV